MFDGGSVLVDRHGSIVAEAAQFREEVLVADIELPDEPPANELPDRPVEAVELVNLSSHPRDPVFRAPPIPPDPLQEEAEVYEALRVGTRDYLRKNGFTDAVIAMSGGIDSSLVATSPPMRSEPRTFTASRFLPVTRARAR